MPKPLAMAKRPILVPYVKGSILALLSTLTGNVGISILPEYFI